MRAKSSKQRCPALCLIVKQPNYQKVELHNATKTSIYQNEIAKFRIINLVFVASLSF